MTEHIKLSSKLLIAASVTGSTGAIAWRVREAGDLTAAFETARPFQTFMIVAMPAVLAGLLVFTQRGLERQTPQITPAGVWFVNFTMLTNAAVLIAAQAWMISVYVGPLNAGPEFGTRLLVAFAGLSIAVGGNFLAKLRAPVDDVEGRWARTTRRSAAILVLAGLSLTVCAVTLPPAGLLTSLSAALVLTLILTIRQRRATTGI